jgi:hypothetical protein
MGNVSSIIGQLKKERDRVAKQLKGMDAAIMAFAGMYGGKPSRKRRKMSAKSRAKIAAAQPHSLGWENAMPCELRATAPRMVSVMARASRISGYPSCCDYQKSALSHPDCPDSTTMCKRERQLRRVKRSPQSRRFGAFVPRVRIKVIWPAL